QIASTGTKISQQLQAGARPMSQTGQTSQTSKWWGHSITIWRAIITAASTVLPTIGALFGSDSTQDPAQEPGEQVIPVLRAIAGLIEIIMTIYGRTRAPASLERKQVTLQL